MRTAVVTEFGGPEVLVPTTLPDPEPGAGQVLIAVVAADVLWVETQVRQGAGQEFWGLRPPYVPGNAVVGRVSAVGAGVDAAWIGQDVAAHTGNQGGYAERAAVDVDALIPVPPGPDLPVAAAVMHDGPTALRLFDAIGIGATDALLVVGASGGLGILSVQLGRARAKTVVAVARDEAKLARIRRLGADAVIDSEQPDWVEQARAALGGPADVVLDNIGGPVGEAAFALVAPGGRFSGHGTPGGRFAAIDPASQDDVTATGIEVVQMSTADLKRYTERALAEAAAGTITPVIGQVFPIERAADAHAAIESRQVFGKTLLTSSPFPD